MEVHTPAKTLVMSSTRVPANGKVCECAGEEMPLHVDDLELLRFLIFLKCLVNFVKCLHRFIVKDSGIK